MHSLCIRVDSLLSAREYTAPIHSPGSHPHSREVFARDGRPHAYCVPRIPGAQLLPQDVRGATSAPSACTLRVERPRRTAVHFSPHTRPPDTHSHLSQQHTTPPLDSRAAVEYQGPLVNTYSSLALNSMPGNKRRTGRSRHPPGFAMMDRSRDDAASEIASIDGAREMTTSFAREGPGDFHNHIGSVGLDNRRQDSDPSPFQAARSAAHGGFGSSRLDRDPSPFQAARGDARGGFGSSRRHGTSSPSPAASGGAARGGDPEERGRIWKKTDFPTDDSLRKCRVYQHEDLPRHIYLLLDILGLQFRWVLTRVGLAARSSPKPNALWTTKRSPPG